MAVASKLYLAEKGFGFGEEGAKGSELIGDGVTIGASDDAAEVIGQDHRMDAGAFGAFTKLEGEGFATGVTALGTAIVENVH